MGPQESPDGRYQLLRRDRLRQVGVRAVLERAGSVQGLLEHARDMHDRD